jgi:2-polyprenyl-3-methyl-5-hydroxy-6-metoxy-1,4-benzoquinol methylase
MRQAVVEQLLALNRAFYDSLADPFAQSRATPQPGFARLLNELSPPVASLLDVGCGEGRFGRFLHVQSAVTRYVGVDFSPQLLQKAAASSPGEFWQRDISQAGSLLDLGLFETVACLAVLQHIPARSNRLRLLHEMKTCMAPGGRLLLSTWQFVDSQRQRRKIQEWSEIGLSADDVEHNDFLLTWQRGGFGLRYVALIDINETARLAEEADLILASQFRSDGKEGDLNLYSVLEAA